VVSLLDPQPGETILDACAAPGGKTLFTVARMQNQVRPLGRREGPLPGVHPTTTNVAGSPVYLQMERCGSWRMKTQIIEWWFVSRAVCGG